MVYDVLHNGLMTYDAKRRLGLQRGIQNAQTGERPNAVLCHGAARQPYPTFVDALARSVSFRSKIPAQSGPIAAGLGI
jgi:hypothetical protein